ncbi:MAG: helicase-exonuclease AddAB subunit AddA [Phycisphaerae bacterium]|nr:helicase-exonuclease AddAB subunit AddA [Phycisphaerae bacterium]
MAKRSWTPGQQKAIAARGHETLVTASAGTGKTAVLTERYLHCLLDPEAPADIEQILALTFTDAASEEMRSRIADRLRQEAAGGGSPRLRGQLLRLDAAWISTIHSFCKRILTEFFYEPGLDPVFRILDPDEQQLLKTEILEQVLERAWEDPDLGPRLPEVMTGRTFGRGDRGFLYQILRSSDYLDSVVSRPDWFNRATAALQVQALHGEWFSHRRRQVLSGRLNDIHGRIVYALRVDEAIAGSHWAQFLQEEFENPIEQCLERLDRDDWIGCRDFLTQHEFPSFSKRPKPKEMTKDRAKRVQDPVNEAKKMWKSLGNLMIVHPSAENFVPTAARQTQCLIELIRRFDQAYAAAKRQRNALDFADLEHRALEMLAGNGPVAKILRDRFRYIFIDEYQDINPVQQAILDHVRRSDNFFVVGDVKQSIYAFRQSRPEIFLHRLGQAAETPSSGKPQRVDLTDNFRSRQPILDFTNQIFHRIMRPSVAGIEYDRRAFLQSGFEYAPLENGTAPQDLVRVCILDQSGGEDSEDTAEDESATEISPAAGVSEDTPLVSPGQRQAAWIAEQIRAMVGVDTGRAAFQIFDKSGGTYRDVSYGDIVILMRSLSGRAVEFVEILQQAGVPVSSRTAAGYFAATEISDMLAVLKVLDNPRRDIELAAVLRSAMFGFTDSQLLEIRSCVPAAKADFFEATRHFLDHGLDLPLKEHLRKTLSQLDEWRRIAQMLGLAEAIRRIYRDTGYPAFVSALPNGKQRRANLMKLHDRAIQFESFTEASRSGSLARFVEFLEQLSDQEQDWAPAEPDAAENAVRILSIHKSKGLEFPVVFIADLNRKFNRTDQSSDCLFDEEDTLGLRIIEPTLRRKFPSMIHELIADKQRTRSIAEEMRILYVAVTRARERLILTASADQSDCRNILEASSLDPDGPADWQLAATRCFLDWILFGLADLQSTYSSFQMQPPAHSKEQQRCRIEVVPKAELESLSQKILERKRSRQNRSISTDSPLAQDPAVEHAVNQIVQSFSWQYPYADSTTCRAKMSVSELTHRDDEFAMLDLSRCLSRLPRALHSDPTDSDRPDARRIGTAIHRIFETLDLTTPPDCEQITSTLNRLAEKGWIPQSVVPYINPAGIEAFFRTEPGRLAVANGSRLLREWPFTMVIPTAQANEPFFAPDSRLSIKETSGQDRVIVQGIVDLLIPDANGFVIVDFKTDRIPASEVPQRAKLYQAQMGYYAQAAQAILVKPMRGCWLYFVSPGVSFPMSFSSRGNQ